MNLLKIFIYGRNWLVLAVLAAIFLWSVSNLELNAPVVLATGDTPCQGRFQSQDSLYSYSPLYTTHNFENTSYFMGTTYMSGEIIQYWVEHNSNSDEVKVVLNTPSIMTGWKELALGSYTTGTMLSSANIQDGDHTATLTTTQSGKLCLQLSKANMLGVPTPMYFSNLIYMKGKTIHINWLTD